MKKPGYLHKFKLCNSTHLCNNEVTLFASFGQWCDAWDGIVAHAKRPCVSLGLTRLQGLWSNPGLSLEFICKPWDLIVALSLGNMSRIRPPWQSSYEKKQQQHPVGAFKEL